VETPRTSDANEPVHQKIIFIFSGMDVTVPMQKLTMQLNRIYLLPKRISCSAVNNAIKCLATEVSLTGICEFIQVKNHTVALCVANRLH
jgi:hypothetical protein